MFLSCLQYQKRMNKFKIRSGSNLPSSITSNSNIPDGRLFRLQSDISSTVSLTAKSFGTLNTHSSVKSSASKVVKTPDATSLTYDYTQSDNFACEDDQNDALLNRIKTLTQVAKSKINSMKLGSFGEVPPVEPNVTRAPEQGAFLTDINLSKQNSKENQSDKINNLCATDFEQAQKELRALVQMSVW